MQDKIWFAELTMKEAEEAADANKVIIVLVGSVEEHGLHLPLVQTACNRNMSRLRRLKGQIV
jgi:creatinine amidohydrolase/Fe(II)-dependent formamide hydrolase-like protein